MRRTLALLLAAVLTILSAAVPAFAVLTLGDVNADGSINAGDALLALQHSVKLTELTGDPFTAADVNGDGTVNAGDALLILQYSVKLIDSFPADNGGVYDLEKIWVEPTGLEKDTIYVITSGALRGKSGRAHDIARLIVSMQGLINRNFDKHRVAVSVHIDGTDQQWLNYIRQEGRTYADMETVTLRTQDDVLTAFEPFMKSVGLIAWDPEVPSTANVASTICGLESCLPIQYSEEEGSLYHILTVDHKIPVKQSLVGLFEGAAVGGKIADTDIDSSGSTKCDAYLWALEKYMDRCNRELLAYTLDGAPAVKTNRLYTWGDAVGYNTCGIPNQDYFIAKQMFFFDLTSYGGEAPDDDLTQPLGTDKATLHKILQRRYDLAKGNFGMVIGFPPWHIKYTTHCNTDEIKHDLEAPRLEWHFVETTTSFNCGIEADAAHPCWMSNGSLYTNYQRVVTPTANKPADESIVYDPDTYYYTFPYAGDYDCSPWLKARAKEVWDDEAHGTIPYTFSLNVNLVDRIPQVFDYIYEHKTDQDYIIAAEGMGYVFQCALKPGFTGKEKDPITRTLPDGTEAYLRYAQPYFDEFHIDITTRVINGFTPLQPSTMPSLARLTPNGNFLQNSTAGNFDLQLLDGTPYLRMMGIGGTTLEQRCESIYNTQRRTIYHFTAFEFFNRGTNYSTPSAVKEIVEAYDAYVKEKNPGMKVQYVDVNTFLRLVKESGEGFDWTGYEFGDYAE